MKVFAIGSLTKPLPDEEREALLQKEVPHTLSMYLEGPIEQFWFRQDRPGPIFLMEVNSIEEAKTAVNAMPIVVAGVASYDFIPVGPLAPLGRLIAGR
jgi:hypothetical protein